MKKVISLLTLFITLSILSFSCNDDISLDGTVPPIKFTKRVLNLTANAHEETIIAKGNKSWGIREYTQIIGNDTTYVIKDATDEGGWSIITGDWFRAERKKEGKELHIKIEENNTNKARKVVFTFVVSMNGQDFISVKQEAKKE